jgi:hypothetical protein
VPKQFHLLENYVKYVRLFGCSEEIQHRPAPRISKMVSSLITSAPIQVRRHAERSYSYDEFCCRTIAGSGQRITLENQGSNQTYFVENVRNRYEAYCNTTKKRIPWSNAQFSKQQSSLLTSAIRNDLYEKCSLGSNLRIMEIWHQMRHGKVHSLQILTQRIEDTRFLGN